MTQLPPDALPQILLGLLMQYIPAILAAIVIVACIYSYYNKQDPKPKKEKSKYPDFEMDLGP
ncbi:MAG: hypothetical protein ACXACG_13810 [Candidatus Thorarchaeota archaeon]